MASKTIQVCDKCGSEEGVATLLFGQVGKTQMTEVDLCEADTASVTISEASALGRAHIKRRQPRKTAGSAPSASPQRRGGRRAQVSTLADVSAKKTTAAKK